MWPGPGQPDASGPYRRPIPPPSPFRLLAMLVLVIVAIWYLSTLG